VTDPTAYSAVGVCNNSLLDFVHKFPYAPKIKSLESDMTNTVNFVKLGQIAAQVSCANQADAHVNAWRKWKWLRDRGLLRGEKV
jgi:hypothetical protein